MTTVACIYRFGEFRLDRAARELWQGDRLVELPQLTFDTLAFLVENRDRAVSRDELIAAVWAKPFIEDVQVNQRVMRVRRVLGDDSHEPQFIRTVPGFGYRWIAATDELPAESPNASTAATEATAEAREKQGARSLLPGPDLAERPVASRAHVPDRGETGASEHVRISSGGGMAAVGETAASVSAPAAPRRSWYSGWEVLVPSAVAAVLLVVAAVHYRNQHSVPLPREPGEAVAVLPLVVRAPEDAGAGWVRLGAMDLIAERLRDSGLPVPPSDSVISAVHVAPEHPDGERLNTLRRTLGAGVLIEGTARRAIAGWTVELTAIATGGDRRRVASEPAEIILAARQAADLLLAALGVAAPAANGSDAALRAVVQRARAAFLALELDAARSILTQAPESLRDASELRLELAWVEYRAGRLDEAESIATELLDVPTVVAAPRLHAKALMLRGYVAAIAENWAAGEPYFDAAVTVLDGEPWAPERSMALARRGLARAFQHRFDSALRDLGLARALFEARGDRLGLARVHNHFGNLQIARKRAAEALPHLQTSIEISESFGHVEALRANRIALLRAQMQLLRWPDTLETTDRLWEMRERIEDPLWRNQIEVSRALALLAVGRQGEAERILAAIARHESELPLRAVAETQQARAMLEWQRGHPREAMHAAARSLDLWLVQTRFPDPEALHELVPLALLHQRAAIASGRPAPAAHTLLAAGTAASLETGGGGRVIETAIEAAVVSHPTYRVAQAEWAAFHGETGEAERLFRAALERAESWGAPQTVVLVADAYARWLLDEERILEALALAGRSADWADRDYDSAVLQVAALHAAGRKRAWAIALKRARELAGERQIPAELLIPPG